MFDFIISGAGLTGALTAKILDNLGLSYYIFDSKSAVPSMDYRTSAISAYSASFLSKIMLWDRMQKFAVPISDIFTLQEKSGSFLHFTASHAGEESPMTYVVPNLVMQDVLYDGLSIEYEKSYRSIFHTVDRARLDFHDGTSVEGRYLLVAEGALSKARGLLNLPTYSRAYGQCCIICNLRSATKTHNNVATELFLKEGPIALLPLGRDNDFSLIWTVPFAKAFDIVKMDEELFLQKISEINNIEFKKILTPRRSYPIVLNFCVQPRSGAVILLGDAFHSVHPVAGQGFNLTIYDLADLHQLLEKYGLDGFDAVVSDYCSRRVKKDISMAFFTDVLVRAFSCSSTVARASRGLALDMIESIPSLKKFFIDKAMGKGW